MCVEVEWDKLLFYKRWSGETSLMIVYMSRDLKEVGNSHVEIMRKSIARKDIIRPEVRGLLDVFRGCTEASVAGWSLHGRKRGGEVREVVGSRSGGPCKDFGFHSVRLEAVRRL